MLQIAKPPGTINTERQCTRLQEEPRSRNQYGSLMKYFIIFLETAQEKHSLAVIFIP